MKGCDALRSLTEFLSSVLQVCWCLFFSVVPFFTHFFFQHPKCSLRSLSFSHNAITDPSQAMQQPFLLSSASLWGSVCGRISSQFFESLITSVAGNHSLVSLSFASCGLSNEECSRLVQQSIVVCFARVLSLCVALHSLSFRCLSFCAASSLPATIGFVRQFVRRRH